jgi:molybdopterin synthase catalytic subunit
MISSIMISSGNDPGSGGHSVFLGQVRADVRDSKQVTEIEYSAYEGMVRKEAEKIIQSILSEFDDVRSVKILHSIGRVKTGEVSLLVLVSAGHRRQAMEACSKTVELIKSNFPVWKKEIFQDNSYEWQQNNPA